MASNGMSWKAARTLRRKRPSGLCTSSPAAARRQPRAQAGRGGSRNGAREGPGGGDEGGGGRVKGGRDAQASTASARHMVQHLWAVRVFGPTGRLHTPARQPAHPPTRPSIWAVGVRTSVLRMMSVLRAEDARGRVARWGRGMLEMTASIARTTHKRPAPLALRRCVESQCPAPAATCDLPHPAPSRPAPHPRMSKSLLMSSGQRRFWRREGQGVGADGKGGRQASGKRAGDWGAPRRVTTGAATETLKQPADDPMFATHAEAGVKKAGGQVGRPVRYAVRLAVRCQRPASTRPPPSLRPTHTHPWLTASVRCTMTPRFVPSSPSWACSQAMVAMIHNIHTINAHMYIGDPGYAGYPSHTHTYR